MFQQDNSYEYTKLYTHSICGSYFDTGECFCFKFTGRPRQTCAFPCKGLDFAKTTAHIKTKNNNKTLKVCHEFKP